MCSFCIEIKQCHFQNPNPFAGVPGQASMQQPALARLPNGQMSYTTNSGYLGQTAAVSSANNSQQFPAYNLYMTHYRPQGYSSTVSSSSYPANVSSASYQSVASSGYPAVISSSAYQAVTSTGYPAVVSSSSYPTNVSSSGYPGTAVSSAAYQAGYQNASSAVYSQMNSNTQLKSSTGLPYHSSMANNSAATTSLASSATAGGMIRPTASMLPGQKLPGEEFICLVREGFCDIYYTSPQRFILTFSYQLWGLLLNFDWLFY